MSKRIPILLGFILMALAIWLRITDIEFVQHWISRLNAIAYDMQLRAELVAHRKKSFQTSIAIVDIDNISLEKEGRWPWPRSKLADLVNELQKSGAVVLAFDMLFPQEEPNIASSVFNTINQKQPLSPELKSLYDNIRPFFDNDKKFAESLTKIDALVGLSFLPEPLNEGVILPPLLKIKPEDQDLDFIEAKGYIGPNAIILNSVKHIGFINVFPDDDGVIRRVPLLMRYKDGLYASLALEAVRIFLLQNVELMIVTSGGYDQLEGVKIGNSEIPTDQEAQVIIPFRGKAYKFPYYSATSVLHHSYPEDAFAGKIVFIGATAAGLGDLKATAVQNVFPGIEINATIADGILKNDFRFQPPWALGAEIFIIISLGFIFIFLFPYFGPKLLTLCIIVIPILMIIANEELTRRTNLIISIFIPMGFVVFLAMLNMVYGYLFESRKREQLKDMFGQYVPEKHIDEMLKSKGNYGLLGDDRDMTVLFADIRNFTTISEPLTAQQLKELLNEFFTPMTEIIFKHRGTIDKYVGDLIMAFWGAPLKDKRHAQHALNAALDMQTEVDRLKPILSEKKWPEINIGIGLNTGTMSVGDMGSRFRRNYTVLGDAVNLASRVESLTKFYGAKIMTTEFTIVNQDHFVFRMLDRVRVKGKKTGVALYEVLCRKKDLTTDFKMELARYQEALDVYYKKDFAIAHDRFTELDLQYPNTRIYELYLERTKEFMQNPPPADWDGVYTHAHK